MKKLLLAFGLAKLSELTDMENDRDYYANRASEWRAAAEKLSGANRQLSAEKIGLEKKIESQAAAIAGIDNELDCQRQEFRRVSLQLAAKCDEAAQLRRDLDAERSKSQFGLPLDVAEPPKAAPVKHMTAKDFLVKNGCSGNLSAASSALSIIARNISRHIGASTIGVPCDNNKERGVLAFELRVLNKAIKRPSFKSHLLAAQGDDHSEGGMYMTARKFVESKDIEGWSIDSLARRASKLAVQRKIKIKKVPMPTNKSLTVSAYPIDLLNEVAGMK